MLGNEVVLEYVPAPATTTERMVLDPHYQRFAFTRDDDAALGDIFLTAVGWLQSMRGVARITLRDGKRVELRHTS